MVGGSLRSSPFWWKHPRHLDSRNLTHLLIKYFHYLCAYYELFSIVVNYRLDLLPITDDGGVHVDLQEPTGEPKSRRATVVLYKKHQAKVLWFKTNLLLSKSGKLLLETFDEPHRVAPLSLKASPQVAGRNKAIRNETVICAIFYSCNNLSTEYLFRYHLQV